MTDPVEGLTVDRALELLRRARDEKGADYVYEADGGCFYRTPGGAPSCIVGHVLMWAGFKLTPDMEGTNVYGLPFRFGPVVEGALAAAQGAQDDGEPWGVAVAHAEHRAAELAGVTA